MIEGSKQKTKKALQDEEYSFCDHDVHEYETIDIVAGEIIGEWDADPPGVEVTGVGHGGPEVQRWCPECSRPIFGVERGAGERNETQKTLWRHVTPSNVTSFLTGASIIILLVMFF